SNWTCEQVVCLLSACNDRVDVISTKSLQTGCAQIDIVLPGRLESFLLLFGKNFDLPGGAAGPERTRGNVDAFPYQSPGCDQRSFSNHTSAEYGGSDGDHGVIFHDRTMHDGRVSQCDTITENTGMLVIGMQDRSILHVGLFSHFDIFQITAQDT